MSKVKVKMTEEQHARWLRAEEAHIRAEAELYGMKVIDFSDVWGDVARREPFRWPLINLGLASPKQAAAHSTKVEWISGDTRLGPGPTHLRQFAEGGVLKADWNYQHIFRVPWTEWVSNAVLASTRYGSTIHPAKSWEKLDEMLDMIELNMRHSRRYADGLYRTAGSVESLLGRWPQGNDHVQFSVLRDMQLRRYPHPNYRNSDRDAVAFQYEYLIETSWIAYRKERA